LTGSEEQADEQVKERQLRSLLPHNPLPTHDTFKGRPPNSAIEQLSPALLTNELDNGLNSKSVVIEVLSSAERVQVTVDGVSVLDESAGPPAGRGLHVLVLSQHSGRLMARRVFDTYTAHEDEQLQLFLGMLRPGRLLVFAIKDEASFKLHSAARQLLHRLGSRWASQISWRDMWAMVTYSQPFAAARTPQLASLSKQSAFHHNDHASESGSVAEQLSRRLQHQQWAAPVRLTHRLPLQSHAESDCPDWLGQAEGKRRAHFCDQVDGYGQVCDCLDPAPITFHPLDVSLFLV
jgi:beta-1,2-N-acetylglucosaminyltransferase